MKKKLKFSFHRLKFIVSILIIIALLYIIQDFDISELRLNISFQAISIIIILLALSLLLRAWRWKILMNDTQSAKKISFAYSVKLLFIGQALNIVMPGGTGDVAKSYFGYKHTGLKERMFSVSVFDKLVAIASIGILAVYSTLASKELLYALLMIVSFLPLILLLLTDHLLKIKLFYNMLTYLNTKIKRIDIFKILSNLKFKRKVLFSALALSLIAWVVTYALLYYCFEVFNLEVTFSNVIVYSPILTLARLFPLTLNGLGSDEALMVYLFSIDISIEKGSILLAALMYRAILMLLPAVIGLNFVIISDKKF